MRTTILAFLLLTIVTVVMSDAAVSDFTVTNVGYSVTYRILGPTAQTNFLTWDDARSWCQSQTGGGWDIASITTNADMTAVRNKVLSDNKDTWLGGYASNVDIGDWLWAGGRFKNVRFYTRPLNSPSAIQTYGQPTFWDKTPPSDEPSYFQCPGQTAREHQMTLSKYNYYWNDFLPASCYLYTYLGGQVVCERSMCTVAADCQSGNAVSIDNSVPQYAPNCVCTCRSGWAGPRCDVASTVGSVEESEYQGMCEVAPITQSAAQLKCQDKGSEWHLATIDTAAKNSMVRSLTKQAAWLGARYPLNTGSSQLFWNYGRLSSQRISNSFSPSTETFMYTAFAAGNPTRSACSGTDQRAMRMTAGTAALWEIVGDSGCRSEKSSTTYCYVCERQKCINTDAGCNPEGTLSPTGYYLQTCGCLCKPRFSGDTCVHTMTPTLTLSETESKSTSLIKTMSSSTSQSSDITMSQNTASPTATQSSTSSLTGVTQSHAITATSSIYVTLTLSSTPTASWETYSTTPTTTASESVSDSYTTTITTSLSATPTATPSSSTTTSHTTSTTVTGSASVSDSYTATSTASVSPSTTISVSTTSSTTPSLSTTQSESSSFSTSESLCEYAGGDEPFPACGALGRGDVWGNGTDAEVNVTCDPSELANGNVTTVYVPYGVWGSGDVFQIRFPIAHMLGLTIIPNARGGGDSMNKWSSTVAHFEVSDSARLTDTTQAHLTVNISYTGYNTLAGVSTRMWLPVDAFIRCPILIAGGGVLGQGVPVDLELLPADVTEVPGIGDVAVGAGTIGSVATGSPTALVRASMLSALEGMLRCSEFDAEDEVQLLNNPASWAVGPAELQYQRGSLLLSIMLLYGAMCTFGAVVGVVRVLGEGVRTWGAAVTAVRMPSVGLVVAAFAAEMGVSSASSTLLHTRFGPVFASDYVLALLCLVSVWAYVGLYMYRVSWGMRVDVVPVGTPGSDVSENDLQFKEQVAESISDEEEYNKRDKRRTRSKWQAGLVYMLEPTHVPCIRGHSVAEHQNVQQGAPVDLVAEEEWLRRNYYFVADRRWAAYGAIEVAVGSLVDVIDGIPLTTRNPIACIGRPASMVLLLTGLMVALVWKKPYSVRLQLWTAFAVISLLLLASVTITANVIVVSSELDAFANGLLSAAGLIISIFSAMDALLVLLTLVPVFRRLLGLRATTLLGSLRSLRSRALFLRSKHVDNNPEPLEMEFIDPVVGEFYEDGPHEMEEMHDAGPDGGDNGEEEDDEAAIQRMILDDVEHFEATAAPPKSKKSKVTRESRSPLVNVSFSCVYPSFGSNDSLILLARKRSANALGSNVNDSPRSRSAPTLRLSPSGSRDGGSDSINDSIASLVRAEERKRTATTLRRNRSPVLNNNTSFTFALESSSSTPYNGSFRCGRGFTSSISPTTGILNTFSSPTHASPTGAAAVRPFPRRGVPRVTIRTDKNDNNNNNNDDGER